MKEFNLIGLGNSLVDILLELTEGEFGPLAFEKGTMRLTEHDEQQQLLKAFGDHEPRLVSGGSVANSVIACSQLGGTGAFIGCVGDDRYGLHYSEEFAELNIDFANPPLVGQTTGTCVSIITPDAERTMRTCLAVSSHLAARHVPADKIAAAEWLFVEGYLFANPSTGQHAIREALRAAKAGGTKVALTCSDAFIPQVFGDAFREALAQSDLLFCNATEAMALAGGASAQEAFANLKAVVPNAAVTDGPNGAFVRYHEAECHVPAFPCKPVDVTGAGDMFAGAFLYGVTQGLPVERVARAANFLAMKVITQIGARLHHGAKPFWAEALAS
ncbi:adenosine kinase [Frigoriglobus tundricola]|uniref:Sugar kinase, ribokinase family protein n=1 Tax=Frigoriglobus tundricola TaxID=2774151 RepID=A0A6M5YQG6_9BACT|nr:adenosine kinase [Frigoriglobus tundricola]QJW95606.1 Sugar kinase, ribokinase family protein [Frigoriglobus tundricola]